VVERVLALEVRCVEAAHYSLALSLLDSVVHMGSDTRMGADVEEARGQVLELHIVSLVVVARKTKRVQKELQPKASIAASWDVVVAVVVVVPERTCTVERVL
jgi:hypothetical protein